MNTIYTLGYIGWKPEQLKVEVEALDALLCDVRFNPTSRAPQWRQRAFVTLLGDRYCWLQGLGNENYKNDLPIELHDPDAAVAVIRELSTRQPLILMCACRDPRQCHRTLAAHYLKEHLWPEADIVHLSAT